MSDTYNFSVSEVFPDGRVMVVTYVRIGDKITIVMDVYNVRIGDKITMVMDVYNDQSLTDGKRYMDVMLNNRTTTPKLGKG